MKKGVARVLSLSSLIAPFIAFGAGIPTPTGLKTSFGFSDVTTALQNITNAITIILFALAVIFFLVAAFEYLTSQGSEEKVKTAHKTLIYGLVAVAVAIVSQGLRYVVNSVFGF